MNFDLLRNFNRHEKVALLQLLIKIAGSDNKITEAEWKQITDFLNFANLKIDKDIIASALSADMGKVVDAFCCKSNLNRAYKVLEKYAESNGINPSFEGKVLDDIKATMKIRASSFKFSPVNFAQIVLAEFSYLWGKEDLNPSVRINMAIVFTLLACLFGSLWTNINLWNSVLMKVSAPTWVNFLTLESKTEWVHPTFVHVICGMLVFGAMCCRKFMALPTSFRNIVFAVANVYLLSVIAMHIIGKGNFEMGITVAIFFGLILLSWLGIREALGFVFIGFYILMISKIFLMNEHMDWRAFPFIICSFIGIGFQSNNFFDDFKMFSNSFFKNNLVDRSMLQDSLLLAGARIKDTSSKAILAGKISAKAIGAA